MPKRFNFNFHNQFYIFDYLVFDYNEVKLQPEDWDDEEDGEWTVPTIPNPDYKGPWKAKVCVYLFI